MNHADNLKAIAKKSNAEATPLHHGHCHRPCPASRNRQTGGIRRCAVRHYRLGNGGSGLPHRTLSSRDPVAVRPDRQVYGGTGGGAGHENRDAGGSPTGRYHGHQSRPHVIDKNLFFSKSRNTPFHGRKVKGKVKATICGGWFVYDVMRKK